MTSDLREVATSSSPSTMVRVVVVEDDAVVRTILHQQLSSYGYTVVGDAATGREALERVIETGSDAILLDVQLSDGSGVETAERITRDRPDMAVVLFSGDTLLKHGDREAENMSSVALLPKRPPADALDSALRLAVYRARELKSAREEVTALKQKLEHRKTIERAKGILMRRTGLSEQEAYRILQRTSQDRSVPMADIAKEVLDSEPK
jgi:two-component system, response regulator PdtaR